jgi:hypothetical protein
MNHGCNGSYNTGTRLPLTEMTVEVGQGPTHVYSDGNDEYNPYAERHFPAWDCGKTIALGDIEEGEELLDNYLPYGSGTDAESWEENLKELRAVCTGSGIGIVSRYEKAVEVGS